MVAGDKGELSWGAWLRGGIKESLISVAKTALVTNSGTWVYNAIDAGFSGQAFQLYDAGNSRQFSISAGGAYFGLEMAAAFIKHFQDLPAYKKLSGVVQGSIDVGMMTALGLSGYIAGQAIIGEADVGEDFAKLLAVFAVTFGAGRIAGAYLPPVSIKNILAGAATEVVALYASGAASEISQGTSVREYATTITAFTSMLATGTAWEIVRAWWGQKPDEVPADEMSRALLQPGIPEENGSATAMAAQILAGSVNRSGDVELGKTS